MISVPFSPLLTLAPIFFHALNVPHVVGSKPADHSNGTLMPR
jgi:hypothetical protein